MSHFSVSLILIIGGFIFLLMRLFTFENINEVDKSYLKKYMEDKFLLSVLSGSFLLIGILILVFQNNYSFSLKLIMHDWRIARSYLGLMFVCLGVMLLFFRDEILKDRKKEGIKSFANNSKNRFIILLLGIVLLISGFILILIKLL